MSFELSVQKKENYLHFNVTGENHPETVRNYLAAVLKECELRGYSSVLIEEDLRGPGLKVLDIFKIAEEGSQLAASQIRKIAYVDKNHEHSYVDMKFAATVAANRGLNVRLFIGVSEAKEWLLGTNTGKDRFTLSS